MSILSNSSILCSSIPLISQKKVQRNIPWGEGELRTLLKFAQFTQITLISCPSIIFHDHFFALKKRENYISVNKFSEQVRLGYTPKKVRHKALCDQKFKMAAIFIDMIDTCYPS